MSKTIFDFLGYTGIFITFFIVIIGAKKYQVLPKEMKFLFGFFVFDLATSVYSLSLAYIASNNYWVSHLELPIRYGFFV